jgi:BolA protein|tara:strand:- start:349 stop:609 length:261 start_codon:yes stop_codon:yes gene_type:complete
MDINQLISIIKKKLSEKIKIENINIEDKSFLHKNHKSNEKGKFHLKISIESKELNKIGKLESNRIIHKIMNEEIKLYIHSLQILIH